ncbi:hypothetical protein OHA72_43295 [Dactylosporangium sp. NBC_01737]|uniref:hypothetical protein n=1 Tax=Dactylosporangium sp. NBC_01737 TaxID=2975959 RepID=UPI002E133CFD|nr:hypothetical protein OHA72_43295 [Dactylosporangium sp. NBC_01737]
MSGSSSSTALLPWQAGLWMAGCLERLAPYMRTWCTPRRAACYRDGVDAFWTGHGELATADAARIEVVAAELGRLCEQYSTEAQAFDLLARAAGAARQASAAPMERLVGWAANLWTELEPEHEDWGEREARAQRDTLAMTRQPPARAAAQLRIVSARLGAEWAAELPAPRAAVAPPDVVMPAGAAAYRAGDVVAVSCPWTPTVATRRDRYHAAVRWPWARLDSESQFFRPDGTFAFPVEASADAWWPYQLRPPASELRDGDPCAVGIPPLRCYVVRSQRYDPPREDGFLPRLAESIALLPVGSGDAEAADVWLGRGEPLELRLLHRPYASLRPGDLVSDAEGRWLRFVPPFVFYDAGRRTTPAWPLTLLSQDGDAAPKDAIAAATATGDHAGEVARWLAAAEAPYPAGVAEELFDDT